ncbi:hypothetical protein G9U51_07345 [Calidifontibacter sp. DB0510]|uniref:Uncharacterized protein n=1 Tax=Metallococcus carri TaxID=1656884 RepID=A0A967EA76_9MICO|nr:hypothetical protein [Metallococcus carri]NHN55594.1 hypothetical protein [Metallococcus carri]NOP38222.1 hypothetical protein [Calidifontibacter sp. DB2511S]
MSDLDIRELLRDSEIPPLSIDPQRVAAGGRTRVRRRRMAIAGGLAAAVIAVTAGAAGLHNVLSRPVQPATSSTSAPTAAALRLTFGGASGITVSGDRITLPGGAPAAIHAKETTAGLQLYSDSGGRAWEAMPKIADSPNGGVTYQDSYNNRYLVYPVAADAAFVAAAGTHGSVQFGLRTGSGKTYAVLPFFTGQRVRGVVWVNGGGDWSSSSGEQPVRVKLPETGDTVVFPALQTWVPSLDPGGSGDPMSFAVGDGSGWTEVRTNSMSDQDVMTEAVLPASARSVEAIRPANTVSAPKVTTYPVPGGEWQIVRAAVKLSKANQGAAPILLFRWTDAQGKQHTTASN